MNPRQIARCIAQLNNKFADPKGKVQMEHVIGVFLEGIQWSNNPFMSGKEFTDMINEEMMKVGVEA